MSRDIIERRQIDFVSADERFSRSPRELTPTGQPAKPPDEQILYGVKGNRLNPPTFETGVPLRRRTAVEGIAPTHDRPGKRNAAGAGRRSEIDMKICIDGKPHEWHSKGPLEVRCARCPRIALKSKIGTEKIHAMKYKAPITLKFPKGVPACCDPAGHHWQRNGRRQNRALCTRCKRTAQIAEEA